MKNPKEIIAFAMSMEKQGQQFYARYMDELEQPEAKKWFQILAETEQEHYEILEKQLKQLEKDGTWIDMDTLTTVEDPDLFEKRIKREGINAGSLSHTLSDLHILRMAYLLENDFAEYYQKAMNHITDPSGKSILQSLFYWENEHRRIFHELYQQAMEENWFEQRFSPF